MKIKAIVTGATGMVGKGVLLECLKHPEVESVLVVNRSSIDMEHPKLKEVLHKDFFNLEPIKDQLTGYNACFFCLGVSSIGMKEPEYTRFTYDLTLGFAQTLKAQNGEMAFIYVSGQGTDSSETGSTMWARVKGKTENDLINLGFKAAYAFRPGYIQPFDGIKSKTRLYNMGLFVAKPLYPLLKRAFPNSMTTTRAMGRAMINAVLKGHSSNRLETKDINGLAGEG